jgi:2-polyprenyl-3-methyl-5-hydroxy-6-metoxy-1,4-benzoquinol methylase
MNVSETSAASGGDDPAIEVQQEYWNDWNDSKNKRPLSDNSLDQRKAIVEWFERSARTDLNILEVGCGNGWLCPSLKQFGHVTATDLSDRVVEEAAARIPDVKFIGGDFMTLDFGDQKFDVIVTLETISCVADQPTFVAKLASLMRKGGALMLATPNKPVLEKYNNVPPNPAGQLRHHIDRDELVTLLAPYFEINDVRTVCPTSNKGMYRFILGRTPKKVLRRFFGRSVENVMAHAGLGWSLMALAEMLTPPGT